MLPDLLLTILHHLLVLLLVAILAAELSLVRRGLTGAGAKLLARIDGAYGGVALVIILVGFGRVFHGLRGWEYYIFYWVFWAKLAAFLVVGLMSIPPTLGIRRWSSRTDPEVAIEAAEIEGVRVWLWRQVAVLALVPVFAAMMARGVFY